MKRSSVTRLLLPACIALGVVSAVLVRVDKQSARKPNAVPATVSSGTIPNDDTLGLCLGRTADAGVLVALEDAGCGNHALADSRGTLTVTTTRDGDVITLTASDP